MKIILSSIALLLVLSASNQTFDHWWVGETYYDLQTNRSNQNRMYVFEDGDIGVTWNHGMDFPDFDDLSVAYNFFNGTGWFDTPELPIEGKNPSYSRFGSDGEIIVCEIETGLRMAIRPTRGTGEWWLQAIAPPAGYSEISSPLVVTSGPNNQIIHLFYMNKIEWPGIDPPNCRQVLYSRSTDQGNTWDILHHSFPSLGEDYYYGFSEQAMAVATPVENNLAFVAGDYFTDMLLVKSEDGGNSWVTSKIWNHPYDFFLVENGDVNYFYCQDGSCTVAIDALGKVHTVFGVSRIKVTGGELSHFNAMGALAHWTEGSPEFPPTENSLHPDTLQASGKLIRQYTHDFFVKPPYNSLGMATMPSMSIKGDNITVVYSLLGGDLGFETNNHFWSVQSVNNGNTWLPETLITSDLLFAFSECIFPVMAPNSYMNRWALIGQIDAAPGLAVNGQHMFDNNSLHVFRFEKACYPQQITVDFTASETTVHEGDTIYFTNLTESCPSPQWFEWSFEGGNPGTSEDLHPVVQFNTPGTYFVTLHSFNGEDYGNEVKQNYIEVLPIINIDNLHTDHLFEISQTDNHTITVRCNQPEINISNAILVNMTGKVVFQSGNFVGSLNMSTTSTGLYLLKIQTNQLVVTKKFLIK
ncbi:MAG: T9SS type A sorting domain-containing protein [Bacteroidales bacterium]|nr:T9SS type A sorting domain-containing protein [Bacteroidales bacterium]